VFGAEKFNIALIPWRKSFSKLLNKLHWTIVIHRNDSSQATPDAFDCVSGGRYPNNAL